MSQTEEEARRRGLREPFSGLSHLVGAGLAIAALTWLLVVSRGDAWKLTSFAIYGASMITLYAASALYHLIPAGPVWSERLRKMDHGGIFLLIAGCYTPLCLIPMRDAWGWSLFGVVWGIALLGILGLILWRNMPIWLDFVLYLLMGWVAIVGIGHIAHAVGPVGVAWLVTGGITYTVGAVVYASGRPRLWPGVFSSHDLWHIFVLGGSAAHFVLMLRLASLPPVA
jgi:hemolysin III